MAPEISYYILIGVFTITSGSPAYKQDVYSDQNQYGLKKLLEDLYKQGNYDISLSHHEDKPSSHHEDIAQIVYKSQNEPSNLIRGSNANPTDYNIVPSLTNIQSLNVFYRKKPTDELRSGDVNNTGDCMSRWGSCTDIMWNNTETDPKLRTKNYRNVDDILEFLNALDRYLEENGNYNYEVRCYGNSCGKNRDDFYRIRNDYYNRNRDINRNTYDNNNRNSDDYSDRFRNFIYGRNKNENYYRNTYNNNDRFRNYKNRNNNYNRNTGSYNNKNRVNDNYNRNNYDNYNRNDDYDGYNENYNRYNLRCKGNRCSRDESSYRDNFRCVGDSCGRSRDVRMETDNLRCIGDLCGIIIDTISCNENRCGRGRNNMDTLRCVGDKCSRRTDDRDENDKNDIQRYLRNGDDRSYQGNIDGDDRTYQGNIYISNLDDDDRSYQGNIYISNIDGDDRYDRDRDERGDSDNGNDNYRYSRARDDRDNRDDGDDRDERDERDDRDERDERDERDYSDERDNRANNKANRDDESVRDAQDERDNRYDSDESDDRNYRNDRYASDDRVDRDDRGNRDIGYNRDDEDDSILRCLGNKCTRDIRENDDVRSVINNFRCVGNQCSRIGGDYNNDYNDDDNIDGSSRDDDANRYFRDILRCIGGKCDGNTENRDEAKQEDPNKMDTIFEMTGVNNLLTNLKDLGSKLGGVKVPDNIELDTLLKDREGLLNQVKQLLTQND